MELWIRSQDRERLKKFDKIGIFEGEDCWYIGEDIIRDYGKYKTKERALEVLDDIQLFIKNNCCFNENMLMGDKWEEVKKYEVFEIPKE